MPTPGQAIERKGVMLIADISGYTKFVRLKKISMIHGEEIITQLLETVTSTARHPLKLNKIEGDAVFMCANGDMDLAGVIRDVHDQARRLMAAFEQKRRELVRQSDGGCPCSACTLVETLGLKIIIHADDILLKTIAGHQELAGEGVILIHRLLKNSIIGENYIMMSWTTAQALDPQVRQQFEVRVEQVRDFGKVKVCVAFIPIANHSHRRHKPLTRPAALFNAARLFWRGWQRRRDGMMTG